MSRKIIGEIYPSVHFTWNRESRQFIGSITSTPGVLRTLWQDDLEIGFCIQSARTGSIVAFVLKDMEVDAETQKPISWFFVADNPYSQPGLENLSAVIYAK